MATLSATAQSSRRNVRQLVVDFGDGTYGVHLGNNFYRVDADLPRPAPPATTSVMPSLATKDPCGSP